MASQDDRKSASRRLKDGLSNAVLAISRGLLKLVSAKRRAEFTSSLVSWQNIGYRDSGTIQRVTSRPEHSRVASWKKEPETIEWLEREVKPGDVFYDIGANVGSYSLIAHAIGKGSVQVVAIEPSPQNYCAAAANFARNKVNGSVLPLALGEERGLVSLDGSLDEAGPTSITHGSQGVTVVCERLDDLIAERGLPQPTLIKLDVDGAEALVLRGAQKTLADGRLRSIIFEIDLEVPEAQQMLDWLAARGWEVKSRHARLSARYENVILGRQAVQSAVAR